MSTVDQTLEEVASGEVVVLLNHGNRGDGLIHMGGRAILNRHSVSYTEIRYPQEATGETLLVYGCGAFSEPYHHMAEYIPFYFRRFRRIVILPASFQTTCREVRQFLDTLPDHVHIFCRELHSYRLVEQLVHRPNSVSHDKDLAFHVDYSPWRQAAGEGIVFTFRTDAEAPGTALPVGNTDLSLGSELEGERLLRDLSRYACVYTDRAHAAIAAAMLGKEVHLFPSNYHKQKGVYEYSLSTLPNVYWHESFAALGDPIVAQPSEP